MTACQGCASEALWQRLRVAPRMKPFARASVVPGIEGQAAAVDDAVVAGQPQQVAGAPAVDAG